jgi:hypothetical protein
LHHLAIATEGHAPRTSVVGIGNRHEWLIATILVPVALSYPHKPYCGDKRVLPQEKCVETCRIVVAITRFLAAFFFLWQ